jgi:exosortase F-associated protein
VDVVGQIQLKAANMKLMLRVTICILCLAGLATVFLFQQTNVAELAGWSDKPVYQFVFNRVIRFILNDALTIGLIYALFYERKYVLFALWVQLLGMVLLLIPYLIVKVQLPAYNGPLISFVHRLILNPTILLLLIPAFYVQRFRKQKLSVKNTPD